MNICLFDADFSSFCNFRKQIWQPVRVQGLGRVALIAVGAFHNLALLHSGQVWSWGNNEYGQLGSGDTQPRSLPMEIKELSGLGVVSYC